MTLEPAVLLALVLLGGAVALDSTSVGQLMLSRPLVAAGLGGLLVGRPADGLVVGVVLEALHLAVLPIGAVVYPESAPGAVAAGALFGLAVERSESAPHVPVYASLLVIVLFALLWEWVGGKTVVRLRHYNVRFDGVAPEHAAPGDIARRVSRAIALDFARGAAMTLLALLLLGGLLAAVPPALADFPETWADRALGFAVVAGAASALRLFGRSRWPFFAAGAAVGALWLFLS